MRRFVYPTLSILFLLLLPLSALALPVTQEVIPLTPEEVARNVYHRDIGQDMRMTGAMELTSKSGHVRKRELTTYRKDTPAERQVMIRFTSPADIDGTAFWVIEDTSDNSTRQQLYLPALKRTRRIVAAQQGRSFVNSDFTYEDMQRHPVEEWIYTLEESQFILGRECYVLHSIPRPGTDTQYQKAISWIDRDTFTPLKIEFWDLKGEPFKTYTVQKFEIIDGIATELETLMENHRDQHKTRLSTASIEYNRGLPDHLFTKRALEGEY
ncbi:MAG: outer membrane lipoprotein-sorting protein [Desulfuromonadaceae bacterium]|nr:outer membrane lipoprotein-sorting protein [Desulfuromonas sp.]MDY0185417.1 outer membrane lipoprotein-sorting protein [Desulfuromonadaceae bacterium]